MGFVVAMHAALLLILARSFGIVPPLQFTGSEVVPVDDPVVPPDPTPTLPNPRFENPTVNLVAPDEPLPYEVTDPPPQIIIGQFPQIGEGPGSAVPEPAISNARIDPRRPLSQPPYSSIDTREGIEGFVDVEIYVLPDGRVGDARILRSTGSERMNQSTLEEAKRRWRLVPATRDGVPFAQWYRLRVKFELKNQ
jgi:protein TonB